MVGGQHTFNLINMKILSVVKKFLYMFSHLLEFFVHFLAYFCASRFRQGKGLPLADLPVWSVGVFRKKQQLLALFNIYCKV